MHRVLLTLTEKMMDGCFSMVPRQKPQSMHVEHAKIIAHRGAHNNSRGIIENTHEAFHLARNAGCWGIEFDVHATADGVFVVNHDITLNRLWGHDATISDLTFNELRSLVPDIPSLAEVIAEYSSDLHLFIELKSPFKDELALMNILRGLSPAKDFHLLALDASIFDSLTLFPKKSLLLVAVHNNVNQFCELSIREQYGGVMGSYLLLTNKKRNKLNEANQVSGVGFVNSKNSLYRELNRGINWIFTNQAIEVSQYLHQLRSEKNK
ncbi:glycerophosphoryl diester phosphodiesterase [Legionella quateirensis]|uniref:Glycerophosphoryl diester phosphodiesterase n=1 Tax=Legionella quateirensis TaxID=45072 RepID=A0A378KZC1_9GAMM|nr:glycerophosphoryl diester phosphodiesterase [Legionella quateirensis]STY19479.1 glycerophosphoryl diester phosphodiesterase [Legionella quateirensis]